jgi:hypothetical protein
MAQIEIAGSAMIGAAAERRLFVRQRFGEMPHSPPARSISAASTFQIGRGERYDLSRDRTSNTPAGDRSSWRHTGRIELLRLWPFAQSELESIADGEYPAATVSMDEQAGVVVHSGEQTIPLGGPSL